MTNIEQKWLKEVRDNTKQLERIAKRLDAISRQLDRLDRKTEPSDLEKPNNSTISKMEQVDEPITQTKTQNSNLTFDTPQTESTGSPIGDYRDGVGAWQTDCGWGEPITVGEDKKGENSR